MQLSSSSSPRAVLERWFPLHRAVHGVWPCIPGGAICAIGCCACCSFPVVVTAEPIDALKPMAFLAGHCWKGDFADEQANRRTLLSMALRRQGVARHAHDCARRVARTTSAKRRITGIPWRSGGYLYVENLGGVSRGDRKATQGALVFPATQYVADGTAMTYRVHWTRLDDSSYEAWSEAQGARTAWVTMFKLAMKKVTP